jgi:hypothetical protein
MFKKLAVPFVALAVGAAGSFLLFGPEGPAYAQMGAHGMGMGHGHGADGQHDEVNMPGLRGEDATNEESAELAVMFRNFQSIDRTAENLPNGIRTVTSSSDPEVFAKLVSHVTGMIQRVEEGRDPKIFIQSPTLDIFFVKGDAIETDIELTETDIIVTQTSDDPEMVEALQTHAAEVTDMADRGMAAVHDRMMRR